MATHLVLLRKDLARINTPADALDVATRAAHARKVFEAIGQSVKDCNEFAEIYLSAYWKFGELVKDTPEGRPAKLPIDGKFPGSRHQREYARALAKAVKASDIPPYVRVATEKTLAASIDGCLEWADPGRHGHLKGEYEWYTPAAILEAARAVMGGIDLDPASCDEANALVQASQIFTEQDDGLAHPWHGRVFLNPPFAHPTVKLFAQKLIESVGNGTVTQGICLTNACVDTEWWQALAARGLVCCHRGRVKFYGLDDELQPPTLGQTIIYLGDARDAFRIHFQPFGVVLS
jgi:ParB family chromosome partitioning protein